MTRDWHFMKLRIITAILSAGLLAGSLAVQAADLQAGKELAAQTCASCHGPDGKSPTAPTYPILAGQHRDYLLRSLRAYKSGDRANAVMNGMVSGLSDQDLQDLAAWYASREGLEDLSID